MGKEGGDKYIATAVECDVEVELMSGGCACRILTPGSRIAGELVRVP